MAVLSQYYSGNESYGRSANAALGGMKEGQSLMERKQLMRQSAEQSERQKLEFLAKLPAIEANAVADVATARASVLNTADQETARGAYATESTGLQKEFFDAMSLPTFEEQAMALSELQPKISKFALFPLGKAFVDTVNNATVLAHQSARLDRSLREGLGADEKFFNNLTEGMTPAEQEQARRVKLGLNPRPSSAGIQYKEVAGPDGRVRVVAFDPRNVGAQVIGSGEVYGSGVGATPEATAAASGQPVAGENRFISQTPSDRKQQETEGVKKAEYAAKLRQERPKRELALNQAEALTDQLTTEIDGLLSSVTESTAGPGGVVLSYFPGTTAKDFKSNLDSLKANIMSQALQAIRDSSPTGGAYGNLSNEEGKLLQATYSALDIGQSPAQLIKNLKRVRQRVIQNYAISRAAFASEYGGESNQSTDASTESGEEPLKVLSVTAGD